MNTLFMTASFFKKPVLFLSLIVLFMSSAATDIHAVTSEDLEAINTGVPLYYGDIGDLSGGSGSGGDGSGCYTLDAISVNDTDALAGAIDEYLADTAPASSPFQGLGNLFVSGSQRSDINPFFLVSIAHKESSFGTQGVATNGSSNAFGRTASSDQPHVETNRRWYKYDSFAASLDGEGEEDQPTYMRRVFIEDRDLNSVEEVMNIYAPPSENDTEMYIEQMNGWLNDMIDVAGDSVACGGSWQWPFGGSAGNGTVTSCFGPRSSPGGIGSTNHPGVDIAAGGQGNVLAAASGEVIRAGRAGGAGNLVEISHSDGHAEEGETVTRYMHNSSLHVNVGESVQAGEHIADEGATGSVTGPHLHFEITYGGNAINPLDELTIPDGVSITGSNCSTDNTGGQT